jgi:hypothetical protein
MLLLRKCVRGALQNRAIVRSMQEQMALPINVPWKVCTMNVSKCRTSDMNSGRVFQDSDHGATSSTVQNREDCRELGYPVVGNSRLTCGMTNRLMRSFLEDMEIRSFWQQIGDTGCEGCHKIAITEMLFYT